MGVGKYNDTKNAPYWRGDTVRVYIRMEGSPVYYDGFVQDFTYTGSLRTGEYLLFLYHRPGVYKTVDNRNGNWVDKDLTKCMKVGSDDALVCRMLLIEMMRP